VRELRSVPELDPRGVADRLAAGEAVALDVREPDEWAAGRIAGSIHIPVGELVVRQAEIPEDPSIVAVCRTGSRSAWAAEMLLRAGYDVANLAGGLQAWDAAGLPLEPPGGYVA
jgi:rhodanese-related sulfurtransferase